MSAERPIDPRMYTMTTERSRVIEEKREHPALLDIETYNDLLDEFNGLMDKYVRRERPDFNGFTQEFANSTDEYYQETNLEKALVYTYSRLGEMLQSHAQIAQIKAAIKREQYDMSRRELAERKRELAGPKIRCVKWQQAATQLVQQLDAGGYHDVLEQFWYNCNDAVRRQFGPSVAAQVRSNILSNLVLGYTFDKIGVDLHMPAPELDAFHQIDLIGVPRSANGEVVVFIQNKSRGNEDFGLEIATYGAGVARPVDKGHDRYLTSCYDHATMWRTPNYLPLWITTKGALRLPGTGAQTGRPQLEQDFLQNVAEQLNVPMRRAG